jgi:hypothetical protein
MTTTDLRRRQPLGTASSGGRAPTGGPFRRIVVGSLTVGGLVAAVLTLGVFAGAVEHITTGVVLLAFASGWGAARRAHQPLDGPAAALGVRARCVPGRQRCRAGRPRAR